MPDPASHAPIVLEEMDLQLTSRCNLSCGFCSVDANNPRVRGRLARRRVLALLDQAASMGLKELHLTGGEPSLSPDLEAVVRHGSKLGLRTRIITNGTLLDAPRLEALLRSHLDCLLEEIDGAIARLPDLVRRAREVAA